MYILRLNNLDLILLTNSMSKIQVNPKHYFNQIYDSKERFISYWHQIDEIVKLKPKKILEIGVGNKFVSNYLKSRGFNITTIDIDKRLKPDVVGDILKLPFKDQSFDVIVCYEVLEHIPYENLQRALREMHRVSKKYVIISLPDSNPYYPIFMLIPILGTIRQLVRLPQIRKTKHKFDGQHYWEIGKKGFSLEKVQNEFRICNLEIINTYCLFEFSYHRFYILKKKSI